MFGVGFDTEAQMYWCVSSGEIYGPSFSLSGSVLVQEKCPSVCLGTVVFQLTGKVRC